jgi:3-phenylpropionate/trans-cinnamate dioxygenase ferredoxin reductase component
MPVADEVLIAGGGIAATRTAQALRHFGFAGPVTIFSEEAILPYDRPPLSKDYLVERRNREPKPILNREELDELGIAIELERRATGLNATARWLELDDEETVPYDALVLATGATPQRLPALRDCEHSYSLRWFGDARDISARLEAGKHVVIVGAGFIGLEVASAARLNGCDVTVVELRPIPFGEVAGSWLGGELQRWHERHGVRFRCGVSVEAVTVRDVGCTLTLSDSSAVDADLVIEGVGVQPSVDWLRQTPELVLDHGVVCDAHGQTSVPWVYAVGDVAQRMDGDRRLGTGHWTGASEQAMCVAATMLGRFAERRRPDETYFWSEQYGSRIQCVGEFPAHGEVTVDGGSLDRWSFLATCRVNGDAVGAFAIDLPGPFVQARAALRRSMSERRDR